MKSWVTCPRRIDRLFAFREKLYAFLAVRVADYIQFSRQLSAKWQTVCDARRHVPPGGLSLRYDPRETRISPIHDTGVGWLNGCRRLR